MYLLGVTLPAVPGCASASTFSPCVSLSLQGWGKKSPGRAHSPSPGPPDLTSPVVVGACVLNITSSCSELNIDYQLWHVVLTCVKGAITWVPHTYQRCSIIDTACMRVKDLKELSLTCGSWLSAYTNHVRSCPDLPQHLTQPSQ